MSRGPHGGAPRKRNSARAPDRGPGLFLFALPSAQCCESCAHPPAPPPTPVETVVEELHGRRIEDPYRWLEDAARSETAAWVEAQNAYTGSVLEAVQCT